MKDITPNLSHFILASANSLIKINEGHSIEYISSWIPENLFPFKNSILSVPFDNEGFASIILMIESNLAVTF